LPCSLISAMPCADYQKIKEIGHGSFGRAYLVQASTVASKLPADRRWLVMKEIDLPQCQDEKARAHAEVEVKVLSSLKHPYIVRYWESFVRESRDAHFLCIVMDFCEGGDLWQYIAHCRHRCQPVPETHVLRWFTQMCLALKYMHEKNVLHRDIKTQNVFLANKDGSEVQCAKIADFGIAKVLGARGLAQTLVGTPYYLSPEICKGETYSCPSDVWAVGVVLYELCALSMPFNAADVSILLNRIITAPLPRFPSTYSRDLGAISTDLFNRDPNRRPTAASILQKPILQNEIRRMLAENRSRDGRENNVEGNPSTEATPRKQVGGDVYSGASKRSVSKNGVRALGEHNSPAPVRHGFPTPSKPGQCDSPLRKPGSRAASPVVKSAGNMALMSARRSSPATPRHR